MGKSAKVQAGVCLLVKEITSANERQTLAGAALRSVAFPLPVFAGDALRS